MRISKIAENPPVLVEDALLRLGRNIRTARLRRKLTIADVANKIGISAKAMAYIEKGKSTSSIAHYLGALWALGMIDQMKKVADPDLDEEGKILERSRRPKTAPKRRAVDNDF